MLLEHLFSWESMTIMKIEVEIDLEKYRISLIGDGYIKEEVESMSEKTLVKIFKSRIKDSIDYNYSKSLRMFY